jgi:hypothetical protein
LRADDRRLGIVAIALFFATRIPLLLVRQPFFDELYTEWIAPMGFGGILHALKSDSGPPLYYFLVFLFGHARIVSLVAATVALIALLRERQMIAACLLAVFPPAVLFAVDGRAYALCAMFVTLGVIALDRDRPYRAALWLVLAAYSHYYGLLFFPLVRRLKPALLFLLFLPGLWLALQQPREAIAWMRHFAYPDALFMRPPMILALLMIVATVGAGFSLLRDRLKPVPTVARWLVPAILSIPIYVPFRFESVVATPLMQWLAGARRLVLIALGACFATWTIIGIVEHRHRPIDDYSDAAMHVRDARERVVASGYLYLYTALQRPVTAFPREQAEHPGWRADATAGSAVPRGTFLWIGERGAPELEILRRTRAVRPVYVNARAMIVRVN